MDNSLKFAKFNDWTFLSKTVVFLAPFFIFIFFLLGAYALLFTTIFIFFLTISYGTNSCVNFEKEEIETTSTFFYLAIPATKKVRSKKDFDNIRISESKESSRQKGGFAHHEFNFKIEKYFLILKSSKTKENLEIANFKSYKEAKIVAETISEKWGLHIIDHRLRRLAREKKWRDERRKKKGKW